VALFVLFCFVSGGPHVRMNWSSFANSVPSFHSVWHLDRIRHTLDSPVMMATFPLFFFFLSFSLGVCFRYYPLLSRQKMFAAFIIYLPPKWPPMSLCSVLSSRSHTLTHRPGYRNRDRKIYHIITSPPHPFRTAFFSLCVCLPRR
jgi:hypothetical protein